jgi:putative RecB family exonuclease
LENGKRDVDGGILMIPLSPSKIDNYLTCPLQYKFTMRGTTPRPSNSYKVGSCSHHALEKYVDSRMGNGKGMTIEEAMDYATTHVESFKPKVIEESLSILKNWLRSKPLPPPNRVIGTEVRFGPTGSLVRGKPVHEEIDFESGLKIHGIIDLLWNDNGTLVVGDYKTSQQYMSDKDLSTKLQAQVYATAVHKKRPDVPIRVEFYMLRYPENGPVVWVPEADSFFGMENMILAYQRRIHKDSTFEPTPNEMCKWCSFNYCCKGFKMWTTPDPDEKQLVKCKNCKHDVELKPDNRKLWCNMGTIELLTELDDWFGRYVSIKKTVENLKMFVQEAMDRQNSKAMENWKITRKAYANYDEVMAPLIAKYGGITKIKKNEPELFAELQEFKQTKFGKPYLTKTGGW